MAIETYPHGPLQRLASNCWRVTAPTSQGLDRTMVVAAGQGPPGAPAPLLVHDPLWLDEATFGELDALGVVTTIFVPGWLHDFDVERFAERYPAARPCAFPATVARLKRPRLVPFEAALAPRGVTIERIPGVKAEAVCEVRHPEGGASLVFNDALFNIPHRRGGRGLMLRLLGSSGPLHMSPLGRMFLLKDRAAFRAYLERQAARDDLRHVVVAHGELVSGDVRRQLAAAAARL